MKPSNSQYRKFDDQTLTLFTSSLYLAALVASLFASNVSRIFGRRLGMISGVCSFLRSAGLNAFAQYVWMLIVGRIFLGFGIGFANRSVPIYMSEVAPYKFRGALNMMFQLAITIGIFVANVLNYIFAKMENGEGWRYSSGFATVLAIMIIISAIFLPDSPSSLIERARESSKAVKHPWASLLKRQYRPQLTFAVFIPFFQQLTSMNVIVFYAPVLFKTIGFGANAALMSAMITEGCNAIATLVSILTR
ncbi:hypothetical protein ACSQ67_020684 [Phaseolus vulgaris]